MDEEGGVWFLGSLLKQCRPNLRLVLLMLVCFTKVDGGGGSSGTGWGDMLVWDELCTYSCAVCQLLECCLF